MNKIVATEEIALGKHTIELQIEGRGIAYGKIASYAAYLKFEDRRYFLCEDDQSIDDAINHATKDLQNYYDNDLRVFLTKELKMMLEDQATMIQKFKQLNKAISDTELLLLKVDPRAQTKRPQNEFEDFKL